MANEELVKLIVDNYHGVAVSDKFTQADVNESIREQLIALNGGSEKFGLRELMKARQNGVFDLIEEVITKTVVEGIDQSTNPLFQYMETRNLAYGDQNVFKIKDDSTFLVSNISEGNQALRRQRLKGQRRFVVNTQIKGIKIYEEITRIMAGRVDFNEFITKVGEAFEMKIAEDVYKEIVSAFDGLATPYHQTGSFDEAKLTDLITHIETATGKQAIILGTKSALSKITNITGANASSANEDLYNLGYYGKFHTNSIMVIPQAHKVGTDEFIMPDNRLFIIASDAKPIKLVHEGDTLIINSASENNQDLSMEYLMTQRYGVATVFSDKGFGEYTLG